MLQYFLNLFFDQKYIFGRLSACLNSGWPIFQIFASKKPIPKSAVFLQTNKNYCAALQERRHGSAAILYLDFFLLEQFFV